MRRLQLNCVRLFSCVEQPKSEPSCPCQLHVTKAEVSNTGNVTQCAILWHGRYRQIVYACPGLIRKAARPVHPGWIGDRQLAYGADLPSIRVRLFTAWNRHLTYSFQPHLGTSPGESLPRACPPSTGVRGHRIRHLHFYDACLQPPLSFGKPASSRQFGDIEPSTGVRGIDAQWDRQLVYGYRRPRGRQLMYAASAPMGPSTGVREMALTGPSSGVRGSVPRETFSWCAGIAAHGDRQLVCGE